MVTAGGAFLGGAVQKGAAALYFVACFFFFFFPVVISVDAVFCVLRARSVGPARPWLPPETSDVVVCLLLAFKA